MNTYSKKKEKECNIHVVVTRVCTCGRMKECGQRCGLCPKTGIWHM